MKVLTEVILRELIRGLNIDYEHKEIAGSLVGALQEIDTLTVSKLRPICDAKIGDQIMLVVDDYGIVSGYKSSNDGDAFGNGHYFKPGHVLGWLPLPIYKPELTGDGG